MTAEQKVTGQDPADYDVCGWADGTLVSFAIRGGRLTGWTQRACGQATARRHLEPDPARLGAVRPAQRASWPPASPGG